tara:strand:+ start:860 stop:1231 length:372 start_codon:yes stop_codon:yes gene_type:complete
MPEDISTDEFDRILEEVVEEEKNILSIPGIYELLSEHFNNEVIARWEPKPGDYIISPSGPLGGYYTVSTVDTMEDCTEYREESLKEIAGYIEEQMEIEQFWPDVWMCSDHGNLTLTTLKEMRK